MANTGSKLFPHVCKCGAACYIGGDNLIQCINPLCRHYAEKNLIAFQREYLKNERHKAADLFEDEDTNPQWGIGPAKGLD